MKIAFLTPEFPHAKTGSSGGIGTSILNLSKGLVQLGNQVSVIVYGQDKDEFFVENGISFYKIKNVKFKGLSLFLSQKKVEKLINTLYQENKIDIIESPDWTGFTSFIKPKCPLVIRIHGSDTYFCHLDKRPVKWINKFLEKRALQKADGLISVSEFTGNLTNQLFELAQKFIVIPNAIDILQFEPSKTLDNSQTILYFGTLIRKKGLLELPFIFNEIYTKNPSVKLVLIGKDASDIITGNSSVWQMMIPLFDKEAFKNVDYLGSVPYSEIKKHIQRAMVCVFPTFAEALPVSWIEAMAMQKPIVASNIGWATEVVDDGINGFLVHPTNHLEYANKVVALLENKDLRSVFGIEARKKVTYRFSLEIVARQSVLFYQSLIKAK